MWFNEQVTMYIPSLMTSPLFLHYTYVFLCLLIRTCPCCQWQNTVYYIVAVHVYTKFSSLICSKCAGTRMYPHMLEKFKLSCTILYAVMIL